MRSLVRDQGAPDGQPGAAAIHSLFAGSSARAGAAVCAPTCLVVHALRRCRACGRWCVDPAAPDGQPGAAAIHARSPVGRRERAQQAAPLPWSFARLTAWAAGARRVVGPEVRFPRRADRRRSGGRARGGRPASTSASRRPSSPCCATRRSISRWRASAITWCRACSRRWRSRTSEASMYARCSSMRVDQRADAFFVRAGGLQDRRAARRRRRIDDRGDLACEQVGVRQVALVDDEDVGDLHDAGLHRLHVVAARRA